MRTTIAMLVTLLTSSVLMAAGQKITKPVEGGLCSNMAKYGAIKLFKANQKKDDSHVSYSGDIDARAFLTKAGTSDLTYSVSLEEAAMKVLMTLLSVQFLLLKFAL